MKAELIFNTTLSQTPYEARDLLVICRGQVLFWNWEPEKVKLECWLLKGKQH